MAHVPSPIGAVLPAEIQTAPVEYPDPEWAPRPSEAEHGDLNRTEEGVQFQHADDESFHARSVRQAEAAQKSARRSQRAG